MDVARSVLGARGGFLSCIACVAALLVPSHCPASEIPQPLRRLQREWEAKARDLGDWWQTREPEVRRRIDEGCRRLLQEAERTAEQRIPAAQKAVSRTWREVIDPNETVTEYIAKKAKDPEEWRRLASLVERGEFRDLAIEKWRYLPVYNPYSRRVSCLEELAEEAVARNSRLLAGSAFAEDPVRAAGLLVLGDEEFLYQARILRRPDGTWTSLKDALRLPDVKDVARELLLRHASAKVARDHGFREEFRRFAEGFADGLEIANASSYGGRVGALLQQLLARDLEDPGAYRRSRLELRAAMLQAEIAAMADPHHVSRPPEAERAAAEARASAGSVAVWIRNDDGPVAGATVMLIGEGSSASSTSDARGCVMFAGLTAGTYKLIVVWKSARKSASVEIPRGGLIRSLGMDLGDR